MRECGDFVILRRVFKRLDETKRRKSVSEVTEASTIGLPAEES